MVDAKYPRRQEAPGVMQSDLDHVFLIDHNTVGARERTKTPTTSCQRYIREVKHLKSNEAQ
jgi:hypothetical protein